MKASGLKPYLVFLRDPSGEMTGALQDTDNVEYVARLMNVSGVIARELERLVIPGTGLDDVVARASDLRAAVRAFNDSRAKAVCS